MKRLPILLPFFFLLHAAPAQVVQRLDITLTNVKTTPPLIINKGTLTTNFLEMRSAGTLRFAVPSSGVLAAAYGGTGSRVQTGTASITNGGTETTVTFTTAYSAAPAVFVTGDRASNLVAVSAITTSNFTASAQAAGTNNFRWLAL
jgi:hypothetical protein